MLFVVTATQKIVFEKYTKFEVLEDALIIYSEKQVIGYFKTNNIIGFYVSNNEINCNCIDEEITTSFIEDVKAIKDLLSRTEKKVTNEDLVKAMLSFDLQDK